jgi:thiol:disulfide interchange protein
MTGKHIAIIYFYLISTISIILMVIGIFNTVGFILNTTQYDEYPIPYRFDDCENPGMFYPERSMRAPLDPTVAQASMSAEEMQKQKVRCERQLEQERKQRKLDDIKNAFTFTFVGVALFLIHFPQARKMSKESK